MGSIVQSTGSMHRCRTPPDDPPCLLRLGHPDLPQRPRKIPHPGDVSARPTPDDRRRHRPKGYHGLDHRADGHARVAPHRAARHGRLSPPTTAGGQNNGMQTRTSTPALGQQHRLNTPGGRICASMGKDQLRQRVAFALSQDHRHFRPERRRSTAWQEGAANYHDTARQRAPSAASASCFEDVTLNPMMGIYLTLPAQQDRATELEPCPTRTTPARSCSCSPSASNELNPDGTLRLDAQGLPIPTYDQTTISETAKVFTGWGYCPELLDRESALHGRGKRQSSVRAIRHPDYHGPAAPVSQADHEDPVQKTIVTAARVLPAEPGWPQGPRTTRSTRSSSIRTPAPSSAASSSSASSPPIPSPALRLPRGPDLRQQRLRRARGSRRRRARPPAPTIEARIRCRRRAVSYLRQTEGAPPPHRRASSAPWVGPRPTPERYVPITNSNGQTSQHGIAARPPSSTSSSPPTCSPVRFAAAGLYAPEFQILTYGYHGDHGATNYL
jgi:hypothetical protein